MSNDEKRNILEEFWGISDVGDIETIEGLLDGEMYQMELWGARNIYFKYKENGNLVDYYKFKKLEGKYGIYFNNCIEKKEIVMYFDSVFTPHIKLKTDNNDSNYIYYFGVYVGNYKDIEEYEKRLNEIFNEYGN